MTDHLGLTETSGMSLRGKRLGWIAAFLVEALDDEEWATTQEIAQRAGFSWRPGASENAYARNALFGLLMQGRAEHFARHNGHMWRAA